MLAIKGLSGLLAGGLVVALAVGPVPVASAAQATAQIRVAHLSPQTGGADVWVAPLGGTQAEFAHDVTYGGMTKYAVVPAGAYAVSMHPTGVTTGKPLLAGNLTLAPGGVYTVVVTGPTTHLVDKVINDNLAAPPLGQSKVRIIQASTNAGSPTIRVVPKPTLATDLAYATVTGYGIVPQGGWTLEISTKPKLDPVVNLSANTTYSLLVLNGPNGTVAIRTTADAVSAPPAPPALGFSSQAYSVKTGDNLWDISRGILAGALGHVPTDQQVASYVSALIAANSSRLPNPNLIHSGETFVLPPTL